MAEKTHILWLTIVVAFLLIAGCIGEGEDPPLIEYEVIEIGPGGDLNVPGARFLSERPTGINEQEQVSGMYYPGDTGPTEPRAFYWSEDDGFHRIDPFTTGEGEVSVGFAIDQDGAVYGYADDAATGHHVQPFRWSLESGLHNSGKPSDAHSARVLAVNDVGETAGECTMEVGIETMCNFIDSQWETFDALGARGLAINSDGVVVGRTTVRIDDIDYVRPAIWNRDGGLRDLGDPFNDPTSEGVALDINDHNQIVGYSDPADGPPAPFFWEDGELELLPTLDELGAGAFAINNENVIAGRMQFRAAIWTAEREIIDLNTRIDPESGWQLTSALDINNNGAIVGLGERGGETYSVLIRPLPDDEDDE